MGGSYWMGSERLSRAFCRPLSSGMADLLDVAMSIYAADRMSPRDFKDTSTGQRSIRVQAGVRNLGLWNSAEMTEQIRNLLYWLSEDEWSFQFTKRESVPSLAESKRFLFRLPPEQPVTVSLFSGGLDSLAGFAYHSRPASGGSYALVSGYTQDRLASQQRLQVRRIRSAWRERLTSANTEIYHVAVPFGIIKSEGCREERGQRTRALVFLAIGILTALLADTDTLQVYENGIGALNLPLNETQLGVDNYRGVHPRSLIMAEKVFELALGQKVRIKNPCLFQTKAEMCAALSSAGLAGGNTRYCLLRRLPTTCGPSASAVVAPRAFSVGSASMRPGLENMTWQAGTGMICWATESGSSTVRYTVLKPVNIRFTSSRTAWILPHLGTHWRLRFLSSPSLWPRLLPVKGLAQTKPPLILSVFSGRT